MLKTKLSIFRQPTRLYMLLCLVFCACHTSAPPVTAVLTMKSDGSHFAGTVVRSDPKSTEMVGPGGDTHTFLFSEISDIRYGNTSIGSSASGEGPASERGAQTSGAQKGGNPASAGDTIQLPAGTTVPVANNGLIDSSFVPDGATLLAAMDADAKGSNGNVLIPAGASVTLTVREKKEVAGRMSMQFELGTVDFGNRHYIVTSAKGESEPGAVVPLMGAAPGSPEAKLRGTSLHVDEHSLLLLKTVSPTVLKVSQ